MKFLKLILVSLLLIGFLDSCSAHRKTYRGGKYRREHLPAPPPGYRGL